MHALVLIEIVKVPPKKAAIGDRIDFRRGATAGKFGNPRQNVTRRGPDRDCDRNIHQAVAYRVERLWPGNWMLGQHLELELAAACFLDFVGEALQYHAC